MSPQRREIAGVSDCEREPIHIPGSIQPHGILFVLNGESLEIVQLSGNLGQFFDITPEEALGVDFMTYVQEEHQEGLKTILQEASTAYSNPLRITVEIQGKETAFDGIAHRVEDRIILELENPDAADADDRPSSQSMDHYLRLTSRSMAAVQNCSTMEEATEIICREVREFTGFDRVMLYRFAEDQHGEVIGEAKREDLEPFLGLHYPESDIPKQARELYKKNWIRLIHDAHAETASLVPPEQILDMSNCVLRSVSPVHIQYLKNMGVRSSMSISLMNGQDLWGLIACHHYADALLVPYKSRTSCVHFGLVMSAQIAVKQQQLATLKESERRNKLTQITKDLNEDRSFLDAIWDQAEALLKVVGADGVAIVQENQLALEGVAPGEDFVWELLEVIDKESELEMFVSSHLGQDLPDLATHPEEAAGVLAIGLGADWRILFFRMEEERTVRWGGDPNKAVDPAQPLTPRNSFNEWKETVRGTCRSWTPIEIALAQELRSALISFIVQHTNQLERLNQELANKNAEIEQFAYSVSHDLKSPLVTVNGYVGALEEDLAENDMEAVHGSLQRIRRATTKMGKLIEELLAFSRIGRHPGSMETVDMRALFSEMQEDFSRRINDAGATLNLPENPRNVTGYSSDVYRVFHNLLDNALKYGRGNEPLVIEIECVRFPKAIQYSVQDNGPGIEPEFHDRIFALFQRIDTNSEGTGVGLASVAKIMNQHGGSYGVTSEPGNGATFWVQFPAKYQR